MIWVCHLCNLWSGCLCFTFDARMLCVVFADLFRLNKMLQVQEDEIWSVLDGHEVTEHVGSDKAINNYTKNKAMEAVVKVLETRTNTQGYVINIGVGFEKTSMFSGIM